MWTFITKLARSLLSDLCKQHSIRLPIEPYGIYIIRHFHIIALCVCNGLDLRKHSNSIARKNPISPFVIIQSQVVVPSNSCSTAATAVSLQWRHNRRDGVSNHQPNDCLLNRLFGRRSRKTSKLRVTGLCAGNSPMTGEFPAQMASNGENVSIWWRHHVFSVPFVRVYIKTLPTYRLLRLQCK